MYRTKTDTTRAITCIMYVLNVPHIQTLLQAIILHVHTHQTMFEIITPTPTHTRARTHTSAVMTSSDNLSPAPCN